jgi:methionyl-tRNA formyltransferase
MDGRFVFVGNRRFVLERMVAAGVNLSSVYVVAGTHLERDLQRGGVPGVTDYVLVHNKNELFSLLGQARFDVLVSNGCPYILPVADLPQASYVNIHPSCLPDLRGVDPVIGAILFKRDSGATCHVMDSGVDTGPIISRIRIPFNDDLDVTTLYQMSFVAEQQVFSQALALCFEPQYEQLNDPGAIYYCRKPLDQVISFREDNDFILQKIKAFNNRSQGCYFSIGGVSYRVFSAQRMRNPFILKLLEGFPDCVVGMSYENGIVFRKDGEALRFLEILPTNGKAISVGTNLRQS